VNHYGLEINITWPRRLLLPEAGSKRSGAFNKVLTAQYKFLPGLYCFGLSFLNPWAIVIALLAFAFYRSILQSTVLMKLLKSTYDLFREKLTMVL
jgi:hypothetical protein